MRRVRAGAGRSWQNSPLQNPTTGVYDERNRGHPMRVRTANWPITGMDELLLGDASGGTTVLFTLPASLDDTGVTTLDSHYRVIKIDSSGGTVSVRPTSPDTINGGTAALNTTAQNKGWDFYAYEEGKWLAVAVG